MTLATNSALIVASLDLKLVQLLRQAMLAADLTVASERSINRATEACDDHRRCFPCPENATAHSAVVIPAVDRYEPSNTLIVYRRSRQPPAPTPPPSVEVVVEQERDPMESPLQPPWKVLPWENPPQPAQIIKVVHYQPDIVCKGTVLDCFV